MNHQWLNIESPQYVKIVMQNDVDYVQECSICRLILGVRIMSKEGDVIEKNYYWFFINGTEIEPNIYNLTKFHYNCNDIIIKNIIE